MPEITLTESQRERLAAIESELDAAFIDRYGCIRTKDVVQYLLDTYTPPEERGDDLDYERIATAEFGTLQAVATDVEGVPGSGIDAATMRGELLSTLGVETFAARLAEVADDEGSASPDAERGTVEPDSSEAESDDEGTTADSDGASAEAASAADDASDSEAAADSDGDTAADSEAAADSDGDTAADSDDGSDGDTESQSGAAAASDGPGAVLSAANQLLTDHEDKWREGGSDSPYEVDLPDGTTETVRTKDDVRGLLFKHY